MSSRRVLVVVAVGAVTSLSLLPGLAQNSSVADLLLKDDIEQAEDRLAALPMTAQNVALSGEIEFRKGHFQPAETLYREALKMDPGNARGHFGLGKLAMAKVNTKQAIQELARAVELDPKVPLYHLYAGEAWGIDKNYAQQRKHVEEYLRLNPDDQDRLIDAKDGL